jgi:hypothetical protein
MLALFDKKGCMYETIYYVEGPWNTSSGRKDLAIYYVEKYDMKNEQFMAYGFEPWATKDEILDIQDGMVIYV